MNARIRILAAALLVLPLAACGDVAPDASGYRQETGGDPEAGRRVILDSGCASCHSIPGVDSVAEYRVGPDLHDFDERYTIAGQVPNRPDELIAWLMDPQDIEPGTLMPDLGLTEQEARDVAAYLYQEGADR
jgi:cytochrome c